MAVEVKPTGEHGKKKWCVMRDGVVSMVCDTNSEACLTAAEMARAEEESQKKGEKIGAAAEKKKATVAPTPPQVTATATGTRIPPGGRKATKKKGR